MRPLDEELLGLLSRMPFVDRLEAAIVSGWSRGAVYGAVSHMKETGLLSAVPHATVLTAATGRYCLTASGLHRLAKREGIAIDELLRSRPVSDWWRRLLLERLDSVATIYRLVSTVTDIAHPLKFRWYRAMPMDAGLFLPGDRTIAVVRQGHTSDRTGFSKRLWRLREATRPDGILLLAPDETRLRHSRRILAGNSAPSFLAVETKVALAGADDPVWYLSSVNASISLRDAIDHMGWGGTLPVERPLTRIRPPDKLRIEARGTSTPDFMLPALLKPTEKRALDVVSDWPWISLDELSGLLGLSRTRANHLISALETFGLVTRVPAGGRRLTITDRGLSVLARRDRTSVGWAKTRWSSAPNDADNWRSVSGRRSRQLLRNMEHTESVHAFLAALAQQARAQGWEILQLDPPKRASRYFRYFGSLRSIQPDAFGILRRGGVVRPFFLEWERRAVRPGTMADRLAPYIRYYSTRRPLDDHGVMPAIMVVLHDELTASHFLRAAKQEMEQTMTAVPLLVSDVQLLNRAGPLQRVWSTPSHGKAVTLVQVARLSIPLAVS